MIVLSGIPDVPNTMTKNKRKKSKAIANQQELANALDEAMKQPGINVAMEVIAFAEKQLSSLAPYNAYIDWSKSSIVTTACDSTGLPC